MQHRINEDKGRMTYVPWDITAPTAGVDIQKNTLAEAMLEIRFYASLLEKGIGIAPNYLR